MKQPRSRIKGPKQWNFHMEREPADAIAQFLRRKGRKQGAFFAEAGLAMIARDNERKAA